MNNTTSATILQFPISRILTDYLPTVPRRFGTSEGVAYYLEAVAAVETVEHTYGDLSRNGWDTSRTKYGSPLDIECVGTSLAFLDSGTFERVEKFPRIPITSYALKHSCECWGRENGWSPYVSNGDFLAACIHRGILLERIHDSPSSIVGLRLPKRVKGAQ